MSNNMYTEYVFENSDYEHAMTELQAILFNVSVRNQALLKSIRNYDFSKNSEAIRREARSLYKLDDACLRKLLDMTFDLSEYLKKLDSYSGVFERLKTKSMEELIVSLNTHNNIEEMENEAIPYVPEADINQEEFLKNMNAQNTANTEQYLIDPATKQPYWVNPVTGESFWVDPANNQPYYADENGQVFYIDKDEAIRNATVTTTTTDVNNDATLNNEQPVITATSDTGDVPVITAVEDVVSDEPVITSSTVVTEDNSANKDEAKEEVKADAQTTVNGEEDILMDYDDSLSHVVDETGTAEENKEETKEEVKSDVPVDTKPAAAGEEDVVMEYDDSLSHVVDETGATEENKEETKEEVKSDAPVDAQTTAAGEEDVVMEYDDSLSHVVDETGATEEKKEEVVETKAEDFASVKSEITSDDKTGDSVQEDINKEEVKEESKDEVTDESGALIPVVDTPVEVSSEGNDAAIEVPVNETDVSKEESPVDATSAPLIPVEDGNDSVGTNEAKEEPVDLNSVVPTIPDPIGLAVSDSEVNEVKENKVEESTSDKQIFIKENNNTPKAILTSKSQITKLRASESTQEALLSARGFFEGKLEVTEQDLVDNGLLAPDSEDINATLEKMLEQANQLYKEGKPEEAQAMYNKISEINKQRQAAQAQEEGYAYQMAV